MSEFTRIYFDTEPLRKAAWPHIPTQLANTLWFCRSLSVQVCVPMPVLRELEEQWLRDAAQRVSKLKELHPDEVVGPTCSL